MPALITAAVLAIVLAAYGLVMLARKARVRAAAEALGADYVDEGFSGPGRIVGRQFTIRIAQVRRSFRTHIDVRARTTPGPYLIDARFFDGWPAWDHVKVPELRSERAFVVELRIPGYGAASEDQRTALWRWLNRGSTARRLSEQQLAVARIKAIAIDEGCVSTSLGGIVTDPTRLKSALNVLSRLASDDRMP